MDTAIETYVAAVYVHGDRSSRPEDGGATPMLALQQVEAVAGRGLRQDRRFFRPVSRGEDRKRQVSLIDEGTISRHEAIFGPIQRNLIKAQIVLAGELFLPDLIGRVLTFDGGAELTLSVDREPCFAMDYIYPGLRDAMRNGEQGALARVTRDGVIALGQMVTVRAEATEQDRQTA